MTMPERGGGDPGETGPRVVLVCLVFHPDSSASGLLFTDLFTELARRGRQVTVLCGFPSKDGAQRVSELPRYETFQGVEIVRCGLRLQGKRSLYTRALAYGSFLAHAGWKLMRLGTQVRIVGGTDPPFTAATLWLLSRVRRFAYDIILLDVYPDGLVALGTLSDTALLTRIWRCLNRFSYRAARCLIVIGRDMIPLLQQRYGIDQSRVTYIPHWATHELDRIQPSTKGSLRARLGVEDKFVVQYSGNMGLWHDMDSIVRAAAMLRDDARIHFLFIGKGRRRASAEQLARELRLENVTWHDFLPREELGDSLTSCDAALISLRAGMEGVAVPSKLYGILASGRAVLAQVPRESEVAYVVEEERCGVVVEPGDAEALARAIRGLADDPAVVRAMGERARCAYGAKYTIDRASRTFASVWR